MKSKNTTKWGFMDVNILGKFLIAVCCSTVNKISIEVKQLLHN